MQLEAGVAQADRVEPSLDDLERGELLGDEQDRLAAPDRVGDQVGDRLRLAGPGRPLDHQVPPPVHVEDRQQLRAIGVDDLPRLLHRQKGVQMRLLVHLRLGFPESVTQQGPRNG